jgi:hypothetical protein
VARAQTYTSGGDADVGVLERSHPEYEALGIRRGGLTLFPKLTVQNTYDDNILANNTDRLSDNIVQLSPELVVQTGGANNWVTATVQADVDKYLKHHDQDSTAAQGSLSGQATILRSAIVNGRLEFARLVEPTTSVNSIVGKPLPYNYAQTEVSAAFQGSVLRVRLQGGLAGYQFHNLADSAGQLIDEDFRNHREWNLGSGSTTHSLKI